MKSAPWTKILTARHHAPLPPPAWFKSSRYSPRVGGMTSWSRRQLRLAIPGQSRNCKSLDRHSRTSVKRLRAQPIAIARGDRPGEACAGFGEEGALARRRPDRNASADRRQERQGSGRQAIRTTRRPTETSGLTLADTTLSPPGYQLDNWCGSRLGGNVETY